MWFIGANPGFGSRQGYAPQSPLDLVAFANPLVEQGSSLAAACREPPYRSAVVSDWGGSSEGHARTPQGQPPMPVLVGDLLAEQRSPRWLGDPYAGGCRAESAAVRAPERVSRPYIAALGRCGGFLAHAMLLSTLQSKSWVDVTRLRWEKRPPLNSSGCGNWSWSDVCYCL